MSVPSPDAYVSAETTKIYKAATGSASYGELLWGDGVKILNNSGTRKKVRCRGKTGYVKAEDLGDESLLEVYFIDVGQGDGVLIRTPDHRHILIDGGYNRAKQPTKRNAADFVDWKFHDDYQASRIELDAMIASHNDADHYGGLWDLLNPNESAELDLAEVRVEDFYHAGQSWWVNPETGKRWLGPYAETDAGDMFTQLLDDRASMLQGLDPATEPKLQGEWAQFLSCVRETKRVSSDAPTPVERLSNLTEYLPGFEPDSSGVAVRILAPIEFEIDSAPAIRRYGSKEGWNTNGNSVLMRLDYGRARILLTGDLNSKSQRALLDDFEGDRQELQCDVAKACHHGSDDVSYEFLAAMRPAVTVISSGDNEGHDHPRPAIVAASATTGFLVIENDEIVSPLVYSTEIARSVAFGHPRKLSTPNDPDADLARTDITFTVTKAGDLNPKTKTRKMGSTLVVAGVVYGLVNVRTNGEKILCATMNEKDHTWSVKTLTSRF